MIASCLKIYVCSVFVLASCFMFVWFSLVCCLDKNQSGVMDDNQQKAETSTKDHYYKPTGLKSRHSWIMLVEDEWRVCEFACFEPRIYQPISRKYLTENLLATKYREGTTALKTVIPNADSTSLTTDSWTSNSTEDFVTVTLLVLLLVHVLSDWVFSCYVLDTSPLSLAHTAGNLSAHLTSVIQKWSIKDELLYVTTDN